ncbi:MAG: FkbM family methyltransferase [Verrucomicrobiaceae bacterium]|nr:FkbM family methyltransferase [Verrucomicrobiaceae bacterium]
MQLHKAGLLNRAAKKVSPLLSSILTAGPLEKITRGIDAYVNFLLGRGSGTGWDLESEVACASQQITSKAPVIFDVGANIGEWSVFMHKYQPQARLFLFEPSQECIKQLFDKHIPNATIIGKACSHQSGVADFYASSPTDGSASLHARGESYFAEEKYLVSSVPTTTIDEIMHLESLTTIDFLKMDVEGHEYSVLEGAAAALKNRRIRALSFEFGGGNINSRTYFRDFWNLLTSSGFKFYRVTPGGRLLHLDHYYEDQEYFRGVSNYVCVLQ